MSIRDRRGKEYIREKAGLNKGGIYSAERFYRKKEKRKMDTFMDDWDISPEFVTGIPGVILICGVALLLMVQAAVYGAEYGEYSSDDYYDEYEDDYFYDDYDDYDEYSEEYSEDTEYFEAL